MLTILDCVLDGSVTLDGCVRISFHHSGLCFVGLANRHADLWQRRQPLANRRRLFIYFAYSLNHITLPAIRKLAKFRDQLRAKRGATGSVGLLQSQLISSVRIFLKSTNNVLTTLNVKNA